MITLTNVLFFIVGLLLGAIGIAIYISYLYLKQQEEEQRQACINARLKRHGWYDKI